MLNPAPDGESLVASNNVNFSRTDLRSVIMKRRNKKLAKLSEISTSRKNECDDDKPSLCDDEESKMYSRRRRRGRPHIKSRRRKRGRSHIKSRRRKCGVSTQSQSPTRVRCVDGRSDVSATKQSFPSLCQDLLKDVPRHGGIDSITQTV